jgi:hypothetical protein
MEQTPRKSPAGRQSFVDHQEFYAVSYFRAFYARTGFNTYSKFYPQAVPSLARQKFHEKRTPEDVGIGF